MKNFSLILLFVLACFISVAQCPMCKTSLESNQQANEQTVGNGINKGILYLLALPYLAVGTVIYVYRKKMRQSALVNE